LRPHSALCTFERKTDSVAYDEREAMQGINFGGDENKETVKVAAFLYLKGHLVLLTHARNYQGYSGFEIAKFMNLRAESLEVVCCLSMFSIE
jgi:hypothetical protein